MDTAALEPVSISDSDRTQIKRMGFSHWRAGRLTEAARCLAVVLSLDPADNVSLHAAAQIARQQGNHREALTLLRLLVEREPTPNRLNDLGLALARVGEHKEAVARFRQSIQLDPDNAAKNCAVINNMGSSLVALQRFETAEMAFETARKLAPHDHRIILNLCKLLNTRGRDWEALAILDEAIAADEDADDALVLRILRARFSNRFDEALALSRMRQQSKPDDQQNLVQMAHALQMLDRPSEAETIYRDVIAADPSNAAAHGSLSVILSEMGRLDEACAAIDRALELAPHDLDIQHRRAHLLICLGRFEEGWAAYDARLRSHQADNAQRLWNDWAPWAGEPIADSTLLVLSEQGMGDTVQFLRYLPLLAQRAGRLLVYTTVQMRTLISEIPGVAEVRTFGETIPEHDAHIHMMSLPRAFGTTLETIPDRVPYIAVPPERASRWRRRVDAALDGRGPGLRVGIVWSGNPKFGNDIRRSMPFSALLPLFQVPDIHWFSLQIGARAGDPAAIAPELLPEGGLHALLEGIPDLTETAALLGEMDLILAVDTGLAHLAGALGRPVWTMIAAAPDWRWMRDRDTTPWYPTMRLFRQGADCAWTPVVDRVATALRVRAAQGTPHAAADVALAVAAA